MAATSPTRTPASTNTGPKTIVERIRAPRTSVSRLSICIYGRGGVGKTTLTGTMPGKGLLIDVPQIEGGDSVLTDQADHISVFPAVRWSVPNGQPARFDSIDEIFKHLQGGQHDFKWVAVDTITAVQELAKRKAIAERDLSSDPHLVSQQDWGKIGQLMAELFYNLRLLPINTILLAQEKSRGDEGSREYTPAVSPMSLEALLPPQHLVGRLYVWQVEDANGHTTWERRLRTAPHQMYLTKVRNVKGRELPAVIRNPNIGQILAYMFGKDVPAPEAAEDETSVSFDL